MNLHYGNCEIIIVTIVSVWICIIVSVGLLFCKRVDFNNNIFDWMLAMFSLMFNIHINYRRDEDQVIYMSIITATSNVAITLPY